MDILEFYSLNVVERSVETLKSGGLVMHPTETCYGFAVDIFNENALNAIFSVSSGNLRNINKLAIASLMLGASQRLDVITEDIIYKASSEL